MRQLTRLGLIRKIERLENGEFVFCITKKGCKKIYEEYNGILKTDKLNHFLACSDMYFYMKEKHIKQFDLEVQFFFKHKGKKYSFRPDILMQVDRWYFVEIDLSGRRFEDKVKTWEAYYESGAYRKDFEKYPPIIIVSRFLDKVKEIIEKNKKIDLNYVFKDYEEVRNWDYRY